jgi:hypothetical protein
MNDLEEAVGQTDLRTATDQGTPLGGRSDSVGPCFLTPGCGGRLPAGDGSCAVPAAIDPVLMAVFVAMAATCSFMLPVATPSNWVAYATGELELRDMVRAGIWLNVAGLALTIGMLYTLIPLTSGWRRNARSGEEFDGAARQVSERRSRRPRSTAAALRTL